MTDSILSTAAAERFYSLRQQVASMEQQMERLIIRLKFWRAERDRQEAIAGFHAGRHKAQDAQGITDAGTD